MALQRPVFYQKPLPADCINLREDGNNKFRSGQYAEASLVYTQLVQKLETDETQLLNLSLIYSNRAACGLKMGELAGSVQDCTRSLLLVPHQVKPLLRRATAYEHLGRYQLAYCDNRHVLLLDSYIDQAHLSYIDQAHLGTKRCQQMLNQKDGARWREKLKLPTVSPWEIPEIVDINSKPSIVSQLQFPTQMTDVQIKVELGHRATRRSRPTKEGFTHDWTVYVRGPDQHSIVHFVEKVVFHLHSTFENPERVVREPPYAVQEMGYAGFELPIDIYFRNKAEPKKIKFVYNLFLHMEDSINHVRCEKLTFQNPTEEFRKKLLKGGGAMAAGPGNREIAAQYAAQVAQVAKAAGNQPDSGNMNSVSPHQQPPHATQSPQQPGMPSQMPPSSHMNQSLPMTVPPQMMDRYGGIVMETDAQNLPPICAYTHQPKHAPTLALGSFTRFSRRDVGSMGLVVESLEQSSGDSVDAGQYSHVLDAPKKERAKKKAKDYDKMDLKGTDMDAFTDTKSKHSASTYSSHTNSARNKPSDPPDDWGWAQVPSANSDTYKPPKGALKLGGGPGKAPAADYSWIDTEFAPIEDAGVQPASAYDCGQGLDTGGQDFFSMGGSSSSKYSASTYSSHTNSARNKPSDPPDDWGWGQVPSANSDTYKPPKGALKLGGGPGKAPAEDYSWIDTEFAPIKDAGVQPASAYDWGQGLYTGGQHFFSMGGSSSDEACDSIPDSRSSSSSQYESDDEWDVERKKQAAVMEKDKGNDYFKRRDYDNAIECFTKGAELDPTNSLLPANRAMALLKQNKFAAAEIDCTVSLTLDPLYTKAYLRRGVARLGLTQFSAAKEDYERVLQLEPQNLKAKTDLETIEKFERKFDRNRIENVPQEHLQQRLIRQAMKAAPEPTDIEALSANPATPMGDNSSIIVPMGDNSRQIVPTGSAVLPGVSDQMERSPSVGTLSVPSENEATSDETSGYGSVNQGKIIYDQNIELGRGHNSVVYRGRFEDRQVAVKCINCSSNKAAAETVDDIRKLNREIAIMNKIDQMGHEHIIRYYESQRKETKVYLVLELCDGTLNDYVKTPAWQQKLSPTAVTLHMARGLHYLFSINVTHRDIRPENVFIKSIDMTSAKAVIADFGQSKVTVGNLYSFTGAFGGQGYIAPEAYDAMLQSSPDEQVATHISSHADMFSLGCLFYFTLTDGAHPFGVNNLVAQDNIHNRKSPVFDKLPKCQYAMEQLIALMIRMKPEDRPSPTQILKHPALWPSDKVLKYFCDASDCLDEVTLQAGYVPDPPKNNWLQNLPNGTRHYLEGYRSGKAYGGRGNKAASHPKAAYHLKAIRNLETHFKDIPENVRNEMGDSNDDHVKFWLTANPTFLMHVYYKMSTCPEKLSSYDQI